MPVAVIKNGLRIGDLREILDKIPVRYDDHDVVLNMPVFDKEDLLTPEKYEEVKLTDFLHLKDEYELQLFGEV